MNPITDDSKTYGNRKPRSPGTLLLYQILEDGNWHMVSDLVRELADSGLPLTSPREHGPADPSGAKALISRLYQRRQFELEYGVRQGQNRRVVTAIRQRPGFKKGTRTRFCGECGAGPLSLDQSVRRDLKYYTVGKNPREGGSQLAASLPSIHLCLNCADVEVANRGGEWKRRPKGGIDEQGQWQGGHSQCR